MLMKKKGWLAAFAALLFWGLFSLTAASADGPQVLLALTENPQVGARAELVARVVNEAGEPLEGESVTFTAEMEFLNNDGFVTIGTATTDKAGVARTFYTPRVAGEIAVSARIENDGDIAESSDTMTVRDGGHLIHPEDVAHDLRGNWDWFVQWAWLVIVPAIAFGIYMFTMFLLWAISRSATDGAHSSLTVFVRNLIVPVGGGAVILTMAAVLIMGITLRPWAGSDSGWRTELNFVHAVPGDYHRSIPTNVEDPPSQESWRPNEGVKAVPGIDILPLYVGYGCASCHGLDRTGGVVGDDLSEVSRSDVRKALKKGAGGMPVFASILGDEELDAIVAYLTETQPGASPKPGAVVAGTPPSSAPQPVATPSPVPSPVGTQNAETPPKPTPEPTAVNTPVTANTPLAEASPEPAPGMDTTPTPGPTPTPETAPTPEPEQQGPISLNAVAAAITVDGDTSDWSEIPATPVKLAQIKRLPGSDMGELAPVDASLRVAVDSERIYVLLEVADDFDYVPDDHGLSAATAVMFRIDDPAAPHMGATEENQKKSLGKVDIWHWELDCGPGIVSGGVTGIQGGNDPSCNFDDEVAKTPKDLEDDGTRQAENSLAGVWDHTARAEGPGADGTWVFEMSRKLQTGDPEDAQFESGGTANLALAYWDPDETPDGWTAEGHLQSSSGGWIEVTIP